jgi:hypothetical protein
LVAFLDVLRTTAMTISVVDELLGGIEKLSGQA